MAGEEPDPSPYLGGTIQWDKLVETLFVSLTLAISSVWAGLIQVPFRLVARAYETLYGGVRTFLDQLVDPDAWGVGVAWEQVGTSLSSGWGILSFVVALVVIAGWLAIIAILVRTAVGVMTDV